MRVISLGSSSAGNCYLISDRAGLLMIECGFPYKWLAGQMREKGFSFSQLSGVLISHEHRDHARCWAELVGCGLRVYASHGTIEALGKENRELAGQLIPLAPEAGEDISGPVTAGAFDVLAFRTFHDAAEPVGFLIRSRETGEKLVFATDTVNLRYRFPGIRQMMLEANYARELLDRNQRLPETVVKRIRNSHMELGRLCGYLRGLDLSSCREIYLMHLSDSSSDEFLFHRAVKAAVPDGVAVYILPKGGPKKVKTRERKGKTC